MAQRILRLREVMERVGLSRSTIYHQMADGIFPRSVSLGKRVMGWGESSIDDWIAERLAANGDDEFDESSSGACRGRRD